MLKLMTFARSQDSTSIAKGKTFPTLKVILDQQYVIQEVYEIDNRTVIVSYILRFFLHKEASPELDETLLSDPEADGEEDWHLIDFGVNLCTD